MAPEIKSDIYPTNGAYWHRFLHSRFVANLKITFYEGPSYLKRAPVNDLEQIFRKYASVTVDEELYMTAEDFVRKYLGLFSTDDYNKKSVRLLAGIIKTSKDGHISFPEFQAFEGLLCIPDALYKIAFQLFDKNGSGSISFDEFVEILQHTELHRRFPFDVNGGFLTLYFGKDKTRQIDYREFSQFLRDFHEEYAVEAFRQCDKERTGFITPMDFLNIMKNIKSDQLTEGIANNLLGAATLNTNSISFAFFTACNSLLNQMELMKKIYQHAAGNSLITQAVTKEEFLHSAQMMSQVTPFEVDILYRILDPEARTGKVTYASLQNIVPEQYKRRIAAIQHVQLVEEGDSFTQILGMMYRFGLGGPAGLAGAAAVNHIDLVKTRMQNQRTGSFIGELKYKGIVDCYKKIWRFEGFSAFFRGLGQQKMLVAIEKAFKLFANDYIRDKLMDKDGNTSVLMGTCAGACAGASHSFFTTPLEIIIIRLHLAGEIGSDRNITAFGIVKELGFKGLYKVGKACVLRDMVFSAMYFPLYAYLKVQLQGNNGNNSPLSFFLAGSIAAIPAAILATPADVIKTRLQVVATTGQTSYTGGFDAARKIMAEEGLSTFWKGAVPRVLRLSPQFGVTLMVHELLKLLPYVNLKETEHEHHIGGFQLALPILSGIESKFGLCLPKFEIRN